MKKEYGYFIGFVFLLVAFGFLLVTTATKETRLLQLECGTEVSVVSGYFLSSSSRLNLPDSKGAEPLGRTVWFGPDDGSCYVGAAWDGMHIVLFSNDSRGVLLSYKCYPGDNLFLKVGDRVYEIFVPRENSKG